MRILVIGGTEFVGRHIVDAALGRGHDVTLFNRGKTNPGLFPSVAKIHGDRDGELDKLGDGSWDAVVDTCGYIPRLVADSAQHLKDKARRYAFVSSVSAYADLSTPTADEDEPLGTLENPTTEEITEETYGPLKALCESAVKDAFTDGHTIVRPGLVVGPHDPTDRFTYWVNRIDRGGEILAPPSDQQVQFIDARDLGGFVVRLVERDLSGTFNAVAKPAGLRMGELLESIRAVAGSDAKFFSADDSFLLEAGIEPWMGLPLWMPADEPTYGSLMSVSPGRAIAARLTYRPLRETIRDTLEWDRERPKSELKAGISAEKEAEVLASLRA